MLHKLWTWLSEMPSTNMRIFCTILIFFSTALRYQISGTTIGWLNVSFDKWEPSWEWCSLLALAMGIDAAQFAAKRATFKPGAAKDTEDQPDKAVG